MGESTVAVPAFLQQKWEARTSMQQKILSGTELPEAKKTVVAGSSSKRSPFYYQLQAVRGTAEKPVNAYISQPANPRKAVKQAADKPDVDEQKMALTIFMLIALAMMLLFFILGDHGTMSSGFVGSATRTYNSYTRRY